MEFTQKPDLSLYVGKYVSAIFRPEDAEPWQWGLQLDSGVLILNKDRRETFVPTEIVGKRIITVSYSVHDTTIHFSDGSRWSLNPTQYAIHDPKHGGEVYPQWPEELEEAGITSHPNEKVSDKPNDPEAWHEHREDLLREHDQRHQRDAQEFLEGDKE